MPKSHLFIENYSRTIVNNFEILGKSEQYKEYPRTIAHATFNVKLLITSKK